MTLPGTDPADDPQSPEFEAWRVQDAIGCYHDAIAALRDRLLAHRAGLNLAGKCQAGLDGSGQCEVAR